jgi:hypothetical protein
MVSYSMGLSGEQAHRIRMPPFGWHRGIVCSRVSYQRNTFANDVYDIYGVPMTYMYCLSIARHMSG